MDPVVDSGRETFREVPLYSTNGYLFMVTIKRNAKEFTSNNALLDVFRQLRDKLEGADWSSIYCIEPDEHFRNHIHVLVKVPKVPYFKLLKKKGWHIHFTRFDNTHRNYMNGIAYIMKHRGHERHIMEEYQIVSYCHYNKIVS